MASLCAKQSAFGLAATKAQRPRVAARRSVQVNAKYGESSKYFDLQDLENTTASWDLYGVDDPKRYPELQSKFFKQAADIISRREALNAFVAAAGFGAIVAFGYKGSKDADLPIVNGPREGKTETGKGGTVRARI